VLGTGWVWKIGHVLSPCENICCKLLQEQVLYSLRKEKAMSKVKRVQQSAAEFKAWWKKNKDIVRSLAVEFLKGSSAAKRTKGDWRLPIFKNLSGEKKAHWKLMNDFTIFLERKTVAGLSKKR